MYSSKFFTIVLIWFISLFILTSTHIAEALDKITGPWLWMIAPTELLEGGARSTDIDSLAAASAAAPSVYTQSLGTLSVTDLDQWLFQAHQFDINDTQYQRGILMLEHLLSILPPQETVLLPNYPNPFNPETWIPYQLAESTNVTVSIHTVDGQLVRTLALGQLSAGVYQDKSRAIYWDGRNERGEFVASGVYFYTLKAGDFSTTKKMLIRK